MNRKDDVIQTHPVVGWDISTVDAYNAMMLRLHYLPEKSEQNENAIVDKIESGDYVEPDFKTH